MIDRPPPLDLCEPGEDPKVDADLVAQCSAFTRPVGDWVLQTDAVLEKLGSAR